MVEKLEPMYTMYALALTREEMSIACRRQRELDYALAAIAYGDMARVILRHVNVGRAHIEVWSSVDTEETRQKILVTVQRFMQEHAQQAP